MRKNKCQAIKRLVPHINLSLYGADFTTSLEFAPSDDDVRGINLPDHRPRNKKHKKLGGLKVETVHKLPIFNLKMRHKL